MAVNASFCHIPLLAIQDFTGTRNKKTFLMKQLRNGGRPLSFIFANKISFFMPN